MKSFEVPENFYEQGFVIIRNVLSSNEIGDLRSFIQNKLAVHDNPRTLSPSNTYLYPELYLLPFQEKVVKSLKQILGEQLCYFPNLSIQHSTFGNPGWHTDAGAEGAAKYLTAPDYRVAKCGIYLQDNTREYGGGILAIPKAHKFLFSTRYPKVDFLFKRIFDRLSMYFAFPRKPITLDSKAGDLIVFDSRLPHGSTVPWNISSLNYNTSNGFLTGIPSQHTKIVIYWDACHSKMKKDFMVNAKKRAHKEEKREELYFSDWLKNFFPDDFPEDFVAKAKDYEIEIASWDKNECKEYNQIFEEKSSIVLRK